MEPSEISLSRQCLLKVVGKDEVSNFYKLRRGAGLSALIAQKSSIEFDCLKADCGICIIKIVEGSENLSELLIAERDFLTAMKAEPDERLACQCRVNGDVTIKIEY
ncbi:MAG: 2Fe-2S iron-sulfur cluster-binding protein [Proteobacteria bacterium]|nr:2Fe-2S iron-sulfur cluster-binding protein [Pseudomonadota bacterium]